MSVKVENHRAGFMRRLSMTERDAVAVRRLSGA